jgi:cysteine dioxygenase
LDLGIDLGFDSHRNRKGQQYILDSKTRIPATTSRTLTDLASGLYKDDPSEYNEILRKVELGPNDFDIYCSWSDESYTRNCIVDNEKFELILLCWEKGQKTPIHDHGGEECWVKVIEGEFRETIYTKNCEGVLSEVKSAISKSNDITYMVDFMGFHSLENVSDKRSLSLHLYAKPIRSCNIYIEDSKEFVKKDLIYDTLSKIKLNI